MCVHVALFYIASSFAGEKGPGTHCLHMPHYPTNLRGLDTTVYYSANMYPGFHELWEHLNFN